MRTTLPALAAALSLAVLPLAPAHAQSTDTKVPAAEMPAVPIGTAKAGDLTISAAWTRQAPPGAKVGGGYLVVRNDGTEPDRLIGGAAAFAGRVEIHEMAVSDGVMRMAPIEGGLEIAPGATVELKPGGYHVMFMEMTDTPRRGDTVPVTLTFQRAGDVTVQMPVAAIGAPGPDDAPGSDDADAKPGHSGQPGHSGMDGMSHGATADE